MAARFGQLVLSGVVNEDVGLSLLSDMLSGIIAADKETHAYLGVVLTFARQHAEDVAGIPPRKQRLLLSKHGIQLEQAGVSKWIVRHSVGLFLPRPHVVHIL